MRRDPHPAPRRLVRTPFFATLLLVLGAACASQPRYNPPAPAAAPAPRYEAAVDTTFTVEPVTTFWSTLGDSTLSRLVAQAVGANQDLLAAEARVRQARGQRRLAGFDFFPTVTTTGGYTRRRFSRAEASGVPDAFREQDFFDVGVDASWELDVFGRIRRTVAARAAFEASATEDARDVQVLVVSEVARTYFELRGAQTQLAVAQRNATNQRRTLQLTQDRLDAGRGTAFDRERARAQVNSTLATIPQLERRIASATFRLAVLLGRSPSTVAAELPELATAGQPPAVPQRAPVSTPADLLRRRPDVRSAERQLAAELALVGAARSEYLPTFSVFGAAGLNANVIDSLGKTGSGRFSVGPVISWPALNLGRVKTRVDIARARAAEARARYNQTVLRAQQEAEEALVTFDRAQSQLVFLREAADASGKGAELARLRFEGGVADFLQVLDAERTQLEAEDRLVQGRIAAADSYVGLYESLGGTMPEAAGDQRR